MIIEQTMMLLRLLVLVHQQDVSLCPSWRSAANWVSFKFKIAIF